MKDGLFWGNGVAMITPFKNGEIDWDSLARLIHHIESGGVSYIVVCGTTAETPTLSKQEKKDILRFVVERTKTPVVYGIGGYNTREVIREIEETDFSGVSGILSVTPYYNKPSQEGLYRHFGMIAEASPVPVILYNVPGRTGCNMLPETTLRLAHSFPDKIVAIKEASGNIEQIMEIIKEAPPGFTVLSGDDALTIPVIAMGGKGVISVIANAFPREWTDMVGYALNGDFARARSIFYRFKNLCGLLFKEGNPTGIKAVLSQMGIINNELRSPLVPASQSLQDLIRRELEKLLVPAL